MAKPTVEAMHKAAYNTAIRMVKNHGRAKARLWATDHAFSYSAMEYGRVYWLMVISEIDQLPK